MKIAEKIETAVVSYEEKALAEYRITPAEIAKKASEYMLIKVIPDDAQSYKVARAALTACVSTRTSADRRRKELKEDALKWSRAVDQAYKELIAPLAPVEKHLEDELHLEDGRRADIKAKKAEEERLRVEGIRAKFAAIQNTTLTLPGKTVQELNSIFDRVFGEEITEAVYMEFTADAQKVKDSVLDVIAVAIEAREKADKEEADRKAESERLEKIRQEQEAAHRLIEEENRRQAEERAKLEAEKRKIQEEKDRAEFERQTKERLEREAIEKYAREQREKKEREEAEAKAKAEAEAKEKAEAEWKAALAPDKEKLLKWVESFNDKNNPIPHLASKEAFEIYIWATGEIEIILQDAQKKAEAL